MNREVLAGLLLIMALVVVWVRKQAAQVVSFRWPVVGKITSGFGTRTAPTKGASTEHTGIDIAAVVGTPVLAPASGTVTSIYRNDTGGNQLTIRHPNGYTSGYAHLNKYAVHVSDTVTVGQVIAYTGATGNVTGPHLHFSLKNPQGHYVNPVAYLS